jgi:predicted dehydrogenase
MNRLTLFAALALCPLLAAQDKPVRVVIAGLTHGHVSGFLHAMQGRPEVELAGVFDPDPILFNGYAREFHLAQDLYGNDLGRLLERVKPDAVAIFSNTADHAPFVETSAAHHVPVVMMEKPLAVSVRDAKRIQRASQQGGAQIIVNYETSWYPSHAAIWRMIHEQKEAGPIRRMVAMDGHQGPKEIHVQPEFFAWLTDPARNGAGALFDFGCYGANLMTWLMDNQKPLSVQAVTKTFKPAIYSPVDDDATVLVQYAQAVGVIEASWNWPFDRKDLEVYAAHGYAIATHGKNLTVRLNDDQEPHSATLDPLPEDAHDSISYLASVVRGKLKPSGLSGLDNNMIVTQILEAARDSAKTGRRIDLH